MEADETEPFIKVNPSLNSSEKKDDNSEKKADNSEKNNAKGKEKKKEYIDIARNEIGIPNFEKFKPIKIYKSPNENNETIEITQKEIIDAIVEQIEISKDNNDGKNSVYRKQIWIINYCNFSIGRINE